MLLYTQRSERQCVFLGNKLKNCSWKHLAETREEVNQILKWKPKVSRYISDANCTGEKT